MVAASSGRVGRPSGGDLPGVGVLAAAGVDASDGASATMDPAGEADGCDDGAGVRAPIEAAAGGGLEAGFVGRTLGGWGEAAAGQTWEKLSAGGRLPYPAA